MIKVKDNGWFEKIKPDYIKCRKIKDFVKILLKRAGIK